VNKWRVVGICFNIVSLFVTPFILAVPDVMKPYFIATSCATNAVALFCNSLTVSE